MGEYKTKVIESVAMAGRPDRDKDSDDVLSEEQLKQLRIDSRSSGSTDRCRDFSEARPRDEIDSRALFDTISASTRLHLAQQTSCPFLASSSSGFR